MNDNSEDNPLPFIQLSALVANVVSYLQGDKQQDEQGSGKTDSGGPDQDKDRDHREYVNKRLAELATFERRASGKR